DGQAALALAELARERWRRGTCERTPPLRPAPGNCWTDSIKPDLTDIDVGISRTFPPAEEENEIREVEALYMDMVDRAERTIYVENQYLTAVRFAERLAKRMKERPALEVVVVAPKTAHSWLEEQTMQGGLGRFARVFDDAGVRDRFCLLYPEVAGPGCIDTMVHSKIMVIDDTLLRVGSANLNNRSFGLDTECDVTFEARTQAHREAIVSLRDRMLAHFCGVTEKDVSASLAQTGSLIRTAQSLSNGGHSLKPIEIDANAAPPLSALEGIADPERPVAPPEFLKLFVGERPRARRINRIAKVVGVGLVVILLVLLWRFTPLAEMTRPAAVHQWFADFADEPSAPGIVLGIFVVAGLLVFPVTVLIAATAATFGPWLGFAYAATGALVSAIVAYAVGALAGRQLLEDVMGPRLNRVRRTILRGGVLAVAAVRMVPIAPFTLVNLVAGASRIPLLDYIVGTILGMLPGLVVISALGYQIFSILIEPTLYNVILLILAVAAWIAVSLAAQAVITRWRGARA
ncbi:MAG TPA: VTT domain-containing protein, partial [Alphaproteobacteria bacterium]|nr:VTT domain-containing protein [Alphaproteobacteria bacterium]